MRRKCRREAWSQADTATRRLAPSEFSTLPNAVRTEEEIAAKPDADFLQVVARARIGFSRAIDVASPEFIRERSRRYGGQLPPSLAHGGINDAFVDKASVVWYWHEGRWLQLTGSN